MQLSATPTEIKSSPQSQFLTIEESVKEIQAMGFRAVKLRQVRRWAQERKLPYFRLGKRFYIEREILKATIWNMQTQAQATIQ